VIGDVALPGGDIEAAGLNIDSTRAGAERDLDNVVETFERDCENIEAWAKVSYGCRCSRYNLPSRKLVWRIATPRLSLFEHAAEP